MAEALYRKYRPQTFGDVVGQEHIEDTLRNAIQQDKVSHAYLFCGPRGTGKTTTARLLAKALLCERGAGGLTPDPDGTCEDCRLVAAGEHPDVYELDAASRTGVENVREEIIGRVQFAPTRGRYKVYIIDEVHMLSTAAFNALLKTLEEPPSHVVFVLATTDPQKVPETIHSRCQRFDFRRIGTEGMVARLGAICAQEGVEFEGEALELIAHRAEGGMRNALTSLEQLIAFGRGKVTLEVAERMLGGIDASDMAEIMDAVGRCDAAACFCWVAAYVETGADLAQFVKDMSAHVRNLYVMSLAGASVALEVGETERSQLVKELPLFGSDRLARLLSVLGDLSAELKTSTNPRLSFEIALTRMVRPESELTLEALAERIERLERSGVAAAPLRDAAVVTAPSACDVDRVSLPASGDSRSVSVSRPAVEERPVRTSVSPAEPVGFGDNPVAPSLSQQPSARVSDGVSASGTQPSATSSSESLVSPSVPAVSAPAKETLSDDLLEAWQNPAALQRMWAGAMAALKKNKAAYGVLFLNTKAVLDQAGKTVQIEFPAENTFVFKAVQKPEVQESVAAALHQVAGVPVPFSYVQRGAAPSMTAPVAKAASSPVASRESAAMPVAAARSANAAPLNDPVRSLRPVDAGSSRGGFGAAPAMPASALASESPAPMRTSFVAPSMPASPSDSEPVRTTSPMPEASREPMPWEDAPEPEYVPLDAYDAPAAYEPPVDDAIKPAPVVLPPNHKVDTSTSATLDDPGYTTEEIKGVITSVFGDAVVFQTVD